MALVRNGTNLTLYQNGISVGSATNSTNFNNANTAGIGGNATGASSAGQYPINGYISNLRSVKGTAVYTSAFTPPAAPLTAIANTSLLTCQSNRFIDNSTNNFTINVVGDSSVSSASPFTSSSVLFDGTGDYLKAPSNFNLLSITPFTVEFWFNTTATTQNTCFVSNEGSSGGGFAIMLNSASSNGIIQVYNGASGLINQTSTSYRDGSWHHLALVRDSSGSRLYLDGTQAGSTTSSQATTSFDNTTPQPWAIGTSLPFSGRDYVGYIDEVRVSKYARYTGSSFTPPTAAFSDTGPV